MRWITHFTEILVQTDRRVWGSDMINILTVIKSGVVCPLLSSLSSRVSGEATNALTTLIRPTVVWCSAARYLITNRHKNHNNEQQWNRMYTINWYDTNWRDELRRHLRNDASVPHQAPHRGHIYHTIICVFCFILFLHSPLSMRAAMHPLRPPS